MYRRAAVFSPTPPRLSGRELISEHGIAALGLLPRGFVLKHIPMFGELAILETYDIRSNPGVGPAMSGEASVRDYIVALGHDELILIAQRAGQRPNKVE